MRIKKVKLHQAVEIDRKNTGFFMDEGPGQVNRVTLNYDDKRQCLVMHSVRTGVTKLVPIHGNIECMEPFEGEEEKEKTKG